MPKAFSLAEIGSQVTVDRYRVQDRIPRRLLDLLTRDPVGTVVDYKMTDGTGIGVVLQLSDGSFSWFFDQELVGIDADESNSMLILRSKEEEDFYKQVVNASLKSRYLARNFESVPLKSEKIVDLLLPWNFLKWLFYSLKDVY